MGTSKASAEWQGGFQDGQGTMKPAHGGETPFSRGARFEGGAGSNPEELIGAALAGCYSMALTVGLEKAGMTPRRVRTTAEVNLEKGASGFTITAIALDTRADVPGADAERFRTIAEETKKTCPVSRALAGTQITLRAELAR